MSNTAIIIAAFLLGAIVREFTVLIKMAYFIVVKILVLAFCYCFTMFMTAVL